VEQEGAKVSVEIKAAWEIIAVVSFLVRAILWNADTGTAKIVPPS
jgi:hypothetical protein